MDSRSQRDGNFDTRERGRSSRRPLQTLDRTWRIAGTGLAFALAGGLSVAVGVVLIPLIRFSTGSQEVGDLRSQRAAHWFARVFIRSLQVLQLMRLECAHAERLARPGTLVLANHPTLIDAIVLLSLMPQADCVVKAAHDRNPFLAATIRGAGYIPNLDGPAVAEECARRLRRGRSVIIFPEGTRSPVGGLGGFARGAAHIALQASCDPTPVTIKCEPATLYRGGAWWRVPDRRFVLSLVVDEPISIKDSIGEIGDDLGEGRVARPRRARALTKTLQTYFERRVVLV